MCTICLSSSLPLKQFPLWGRGCVWYLSLNKPTFVKIDLACEPLILGLCWIWQQREKNINTQNDVIIKSISQTSGKLEWNCEIAQVRYASAEEACKAARLVNFHAFSTMVHRQQRKMSCRIFLWKLLAVQVVHKRGWNRMDETRKKGWRYDDSCRKHASNGDMQQACRGREKNTVHLHSP